MVSEKTRGEEKEFTRSGVRTHADIRPLELKSNALTTRPSWLKKVESYNQTNLSDKCWLRKHIDDNIHGKQKIEKKSREEVDWNPRNHKSKMPRKA